MNYYFNIQECEKIMQKNYGDRKNFLGNTINFHPLRQQFFLLKRKNYGIHKLMYDKSTKYFNIK